MKNNKIIKRKEINKLIKKYIIQYTNLNLKLKFKFKI